MFENKDQSTGKIFVLWGIQHPFCWMVLRSEVAEEYIVPLNLYF